MLQSHYRSTLDLTDQALQAAEKGFKRLMEAFKTLQNLKHPGEGEVGDLDKELRDLMEQTYLEMDDDFNTPKALARIFEIVPKINGLKEGHLNWIDVKAETIDELKSFFNIFIFQIFGL
jgi:cysteinyl-tRNA synthetase